MRPAARLGASALMFAVAFAAGPACVDLFHATDFQLCETDPVTGACATDAGADGSGDGSTDAASDAGAEKITDLCSQTQQEARANAERMCALMQACEGSFGDQRLGMCILRAQFAFDCTITPALRPLGASEEYWRCLANAKSCDDIDTCIFHGPPPTCVAGNGGSTTFSQCVRPVDEGSWTTPTIRVECSGNGQRPRAVEPCLASSQTCTVGNDGKARCTGALGTSGCPSSPKCVGAYTVQCEDGDPVDHGVDCSLAGGQECTKANGSATCVPAENGDACVQASLTCDGELAHIECENGTSRTFDCGVLGMVCGRSQPYSETNPSGLCSPRPFKLTCDLRTEADTCDNGDVVTCTTFEKRRISCRDLGLGPCSIDHPACTLP